MIELTSSRRSALRARAHNLHPVASISQNGLSESVLAEIDRGLKAHELIKVRVYGVERLERKALLDEICARLDAAPVQHIGNVLVVYRASPEDSQAGVHVRHKTPEKSKSSNPISRNPLKPDLNRRVSKRRDSKAGKTE